MDANSLPGGRTEGRQSGAAGQQCRVAVAALHSVLDEEPVLRYQSVDRAENQIVQLRDILIDALRQGRVANEAETRQCLERVNVALSLVVGVEYPGAGIQQKPLETAALILEECCGSFFSA